MILTVGLWTAMACVPVEGDRILARDVAQAEPAFARWPPDTDLGYAPAPGLRRVLRTAELDRLARRQGIEAGSTADLCVERPTAPLAPDALRAALLRAVGDPEASIQILDWSRYPAPRGALEFPRAAVVPEGTGAPVLWKGFVKYGERGRFSIWVRARIEVRGPQVSAREDLAVGHRVQSGQLRLDSVTLSPFGAQPARTLDEVVGRLPRRPISAGSPVFPSQLEVPPEIHSGDAVTVQVTSGRASLRLEGVAGGDGRRGDFIPVRNPANGRTFRARVEGVGKVALAVPSGPEQPPPGEK
ncbi:MAG TPA: flagellar basal body P-ring formation chaperone FlgA [Bryobacteraceae bacterium]|nr:flagellar basal body P-ring formation chaperone FlgA [Bryobacteraceae bacterium]